MRFLKLTAVLATAAALMASAAFAGEGCSASKASASAAGAGCSAKQMAGCSGSGMSNVRVEATRLGSGGLVVHYRGTTPEAVAYLQAKAVGTADKFCCNMTSKMASNTECKVDMAKVTDGVLVFVTSGKQEVVDQYEKEFAALTTAPAAATK